MLKGRQSGGMHRGHAWVFRAESYDTMLAWFSDIKNLTEKTGAERKEFIRRSHARSVSTGSHKTGSISSDGGIDEDEADEVPYSATASQVEIAPQVETLPQRPNPGGRFPSALKINRDSQVPVSSSRSPSSSTGDREIIAAAGLLPGSGFPSGSLGQQVQASHDETNATRGELDGASAAPLRINSYSPMASKQGPEGITLQKGSNSVTAGGSQINSLEQSQSTDLSKDPGSITYHQKQVAPVPESSPFNVESHGDWLAGVGGEAGVAGTEAFQHDVKQDGSAAQGNQAGVQTTTAATQVFAPALQEFGHPSSFSGTNDTSKQSISPITSGPVSRTSDPASPSSDLASRPSLGSRVATISELHVPGEFPKLPVKSL